MGVNGGIAMHIGLVSSTPYPPSTTDVRGISNYVQNLAWKFVEWGHKVTVVTRGGLALDQSYMNSLRILRVPHLPVYPFHVHIHGLFMSKLIRQLEPELDILHAHSPYIPPIVTGLPLLTTIHTLELLEAAHYRATWPLRLSYHVSARVFSSLERELFENSDALTAVSAHVFRDLREFYGIKREGVVIGNGVDETAFAPLSDRKEMNYALYVGRIDYRKGLFDLMKCAKRVCEERPDMSFVLAGSGPLTGLLSKEAGRLGVEKKVSLLGYVSKTRLVRLYQNASVFILPSYYEGLPTVMLEAMACGVPVVATSIAGHTDVISNGLNGFLVPVSDSEQMAKCILALMADHKLRGKMGRAARQTIEEKYTWNRVSEAVMECYGRLT
jgi:glycosyltransferase involved in cell wall biosynthesis